MRKPLGQIAYEAYADFLGLTADWAGIAPTVRQAWVMAGASVLETLLESLSPPHGTTVSPTEEPICPVVENPATVGRPDAVPVVQLPPGAADLIRVDCKACGHPDSAHTQASRAGCLTGSDIDGDDWFCACMLNRGQVRSGATS